MAAAGATVASVAYSNATPAAASSESSERDSVYKELVKHSSHGTLGELKAAGKKRRDESNCAFCKWMKSGPCGQVYEDHLGSLDVERGLGNLKEMDPLSAFLFF